MISATERLCILASQVSNYHDGLGWSHRRIKVTMSLNPLSLERLLASRPASLPVLLSPPEQPQRVVLQ